MAAFDNDDTSRNDFDWDDGGPVQRLWRVFAWHGLRSSNSMHGFLGHIQSRQFFVLIETSQKVTLRKTQAKEAITGRPDTANPPRFCIDRPKLQLIYDKHSAGDRRLENVRKATSARLPFPGQSPAKRTPLRHLSFKNFLDAIVDVARISFPSEYRKRGATAAVDCLFPSLLQTVPEDQWLPWGCSPRAAESFSHVAGVRSLCYRFRDAFLAIFINFCRPNAKHVDLSTHEPSGCVEPSGYRPAKPGSMRLPQWLAACDAMFYFTSETPNVMTKQHLGQVFVQICTSGSRSNPPEIDFSEFVEGICTIALCVLKRRTRPLKLNYSRPLKCIFQPLDPSEDGAALNAAPELVLKHLIHRIYKSPGVQSTLTSFMPMLRSVASMLKEDGYPSSYLLASKEVEETNGLAVVQEAGLMTRRSDLSDFESESYFIEEEDSGEVSDRVTLANPSSTVSGEDIQPFSDNTVVSAGTHRRASFQSKSSLSNSRSGVTGGDKMRISRAASSENSSRGSARSRLKGHGVTGSSRKSRTSVIGSSRAAGDSKTTFKRSGGNNSAHRAPKPLFLGKYDQDDLRPELSISRLMSLSDLPEYNKVEHAMRSPDGKWRIPEGIDEDEDVVDEETKYDGNISYPYGNDAPMNFASSQVAIVDSLSNTWIEYFDEEKQLPYYFNVKRSETQWERPKGENVVPYDPEVVLVARGNQSDVTFAFKEEAAKRLRSIRSSQSSRISSKKVPGEASTDEYHQQSRRHMDNRSSTPTNMARSMVAQKLPIRLPSSGRKGKFGPTTF